MNQKSIIIGAGIAGIAAAIRLSVKGYLVEVFESNPYPGGKLSEITRGGYRFDAGPSLFTLPEQIEELFHLAGKSPAEHFGYTKLDIACHYFWGDGKSLKAYGDINAFAEEVETKLGEPAENIRKALRSSAFIYEHLAPLFMHRSLHQWNTWVNPQALRS